MLVTVRKGIVQVVVVSIFLVVAFWLTNTASESELVRHAVQEFGYLGIFIVSAISGFNLVVPIPVITFFGVFLEAGLSFWLTISVISLGMTTGDAIGFLLGNAGRQFVTHEKTHASGIARTIDRFATRHPLWPYALLFLYASLAPAPNELIVIPMAFAGYKLRYMFPVLLVGNTIFNTLAAMSIVNIVTFF